MSELIEMQRKKPWCKVSMNLTEKTEWIKKKEGNRELEKKIMGTKIPRVLHQLYKNETIPSKWKVSLFVFHNFYLGKSLKKVSFDSWNRYTNSTECSPHKWERVIWTDESAEKLIRMHYSWFLPTLNSYKRKIQKVDAYKYEGDF